MRLDHALPSVLLGALVTIAGAGCPGTLDDPDNFRAGNLCPDVPTELLVPRCGSANCHAAFTPAGGLDLVTPEVAARVVGVPAVGPACTDSGLILAVPTDPGASLLFRKISGTPPCGSSMPLGGDRLTPKEVSCVKEWISTLHAGDGPDAGAAAR